MLGKIKYSGEDLYPYERTAVEYRPKKARPVHASYETIKGAGSAAVGDNPVADPTVTVDYAVENEFVPYWATNSPFFNTPGIIQPCQRFKPKEETNEDSVPIYRKYALTIKEAVAYFGIGERKLRKLVDANEFADWFLMNGAKILIKRKQFEKYLDEASCI